jgi:hypothetical protein
MFPPPAGTAHTPAPFQKVEAVAPVPLLRFDTGRFPEYAFAVTTPEPEGARLPATNRETPKGAVPLVMLLNAKVEGFEGVQHPCAFPYTSIPIAACVKRHFVGAAESAVAVAAFPDVFAALFGMSVETKVGRRLWESVVVSVFAEAAIPDVFAALFGISPERRIGKEAWGKVPLTPVARGITGIIVVVRLQKLGMPELFVQFP